MKDLVIFTPVLPPGINNTYGHGRQGQVFLKPEAKSWKEEFQLLVRNAGNVVNWNDEKDQYAIVIYWWGGRFDADAHLKITQDAVAGGCSFNDKKIKSSHIERLSVDEVQAIFGNWDFRNQKTGLVAILKGI